MIDVYCENGKCPICDSNVKKSIKSLSASCKNGCYFIEWDSSKSDKALVLILLDKDTKYRLRPNSINASLIKRIMYWKENERYLMEMLGD